MLQDRIEAGDQSLRVQEGNGFFVGLSEPDGGKIGLMIEFLDDPGPGYFLGVTCDAVRARDIAAALIELAEICEKHE